MEESRTLVDISGERTWPDIRPEDLDIQRTHSISWILMARSTPRAMSRISSRHLESSCPPRCEVILLTFPALFQPSGSRLLTAIAKSSGGRNNSLSSRSKGKRTMQNLLLSITGNPFMDACTLSMQYISEITCLLYSNAVVGLKVP